MTMTCFVDGACRVSNPGLAASSYVIYDEGCRELETGAFVHPSPQTNNFAEYMGLLSFLHRAERAGWKKVTVYSDSSLVVNQCVGGWSVSSKFANFANAAQAMLTRGDHTLIHMRGHEKDPRKGLHRGNSRADELCNEVLDAWQAQKGQDGEKV